MTFNKLLPNNADALEKLSDKELHEKLSPYFTVTRPTEAAKIAKPKITTEKQSKLEKAKQDPRFKALFGDIEL